MKRGRGQTDAPDKVILEKCRIIRVKDIFYSRFDNFKRTHENRDGTFHERWYYFNLFLDVNFK